MFKEEIYRIKYLLLAQILILLASAFLDFIPFYLVIGTAVLTLISIKSFNDPVFALFTLMIVMIVDALIPFKFKSTGPSLLVTEFFLIILITVLLMKFLFENKKVENYNLLVIWLPFLFWSLIIGLLVGVDKLKVISFWKNFFIGFISLSIILLFVKKDVQVKRIFLALIIWGVILSLLEIKVLIEVGGLAAGFVGLFLYKNLLSVGWGKSNYLAAFFVVIIPLTIGYLIYSRKHYSKFFITLALLIMFFAITLTLSRGGILALLLTLVILLPKIISKKYFFSFLFVFISIIVLLLINPLTYVIIDRIATLETSSSVYSRINFYEDVWNAFLNNPFTGVGLGNLGYYSKFILGPELSPSAHNIILGALGELGLFGAVLYLMIFVVIVIEIYKNYKKENDEKLRKVRWCLFASVLGGLIHTLVEPTLEGLQFSIIYWTIVGVNFKLNILDKNYSVEKS